MRRKLRFGMIGGGRGAFIGARAPDRGRDGRPGRAGGRGLLQRSRPVQGLRAPTSSSIPRASTGPTGRWPRPRPRCPPEPRLDFVVIVTPNHQHFGPARLFLESGFNVVCDKPVTFDLAAGEEAAGRSSSRSDKVFVLTHNYTGNAMVKQARELVRDGSARHDPQGRRRIPAGLAGRRPRAHRPEAGVLADRPEAQRRGRLHGRHRHPRREPRPLHHGPRDRGALRGPDDLRQGPQARRRRQRARALQGRRQGRPARLADLRRRREQPEHPGLRRRRPRWSGTRSIPTSSSSNSPTSRARSGGAATATSAPRPSASPGSPPGTPRATSRPSPTSTARRFRAIAAEVEGRPTPRNLDFPTIEDGVEGMAFIEAVVRSSRLGASGSGRRRIDAAPANLRHRGRPPGSRPESPKKASSGGWQIPAWSFPIAGTLRAEVGAPPGSEPGRARFSSYSLIGKKAGSCRSPRRRGSPAPHPSPRRRSANSSSPC